MLAPRLGKGKASLFPFDRSTSLIKKALQKRRAPTFRIFSYKQSLRSKRHQRPKASKKTNKKAARSSANTGTLVIKDVPMYEYRVRSGLNPQKTRNPATRKSVPKILTSSHNPAKIIQKNTVPAHSSPVYSISSSSKFSSLR